MLTYTKQWQVVDSIKYGDSLFWLRLETYDAIFVRVNCMLSKRLIRVKAPFINEEICSLVLMFFVVISNQP